MFQKLINWSLKEYSHLPWRVNRGPYQTLVSEFMLQQTTVPTVIRYFDPFLQRFPNVRILSRATEEEVCIQWKGLGYYRRARSLLNASKQIQEQFGGTIPLEVEHLLKIKGIGPYTAQALRSIGADLVALPVDANLERVLSRLFLIEGQKGPSLQKKILHLFQKGKILADMALWGPRNLSEALMDLGRMICRAQGPLCEKCPVRQNCQAYLQKKVAEFPQGQLEQGQKKGKSLQELVLLRLLVREKENVLVYQKGESEWLSGQLELPTYIIQTSDLSLRQYPQISGLLKISKKSSFVDFETLPSFKSTITKYRITNLVWEMSKRCFEGYCRDFPSPVFFRPFNSNQFNFATTVMKSIKKAGEGEGSERKKRN